MAEQLRLYSYWRSSAAYRVRIGLNLKGLAYETVPVHLVRDGGQQHAPDYVARNPQHMVPTLQHGVRVIRQSLAILEYLEERYPQTPLLPADSAGRARVRQLMQLIACDIHPLNNLRVLNYLTGPLALTEQQKLDWIHHWIELGFDALEKQLTTDGGRGRFCHGDTPTLADTCLIPQVVGAKRFSVDLSRYPKLMRIFDDCMKLPAFDKAQPSKQPDFEA